MEYKENGNAAFKRGEIDDAIDAYKRALDEEDTDEALRKACFGNLAACYLAQQKNKECVEACTNALAIDPDYVKALQRRATANERIERWSALESALEDYKRLVELDPSLAPTYRKSIASLPDRIQVQQEKDKEELMGMARNAGNTVLGWFGMSMDNIKFDEQPGGGYGVRIER